MPLQATSGAASYDAFGGGGIPYIPQYIEEVFSTWVYTGVSGSNVTVNNGINLTANAGLIWTKGRNEPNPHSLTDTVRGVSFQLNSATTSEQSGSGISSFTSTGYITNQQGQTNGGSSETYVSWTFREQPKFFDIVTYTGNGSTQNIAHNLGSTPGCIIVKEASAAGNDWQVYHRSTTNVCGRLFLNLPNAENASGRANTWGDNTNPVPPTSTVFTVGNTGAVNNNGATFVAYLFAHNAGGFGLTGTDNVITCGSFTANGSGNATVTLGYEPQWLMWKSATVGEQWNMQDIMRGFTNNGTSDKRLFPNLSNAEQTGDYFHPTATGFTSTSGLLQSSQTYIYIAIRRGPMKVPTTGTSVFSPNTYTTPATPLTVTTNFPVDLSIVAFRTVSAGKSAVDRLRGGTTTTYSSLQTQSSNAEISGTGIGIGFQNNTAIIDNSFASGAGQNPIYWNFRRAPSFFDEVCYTGTGGVTTVAHNLTVAPELIIIKGRNTDPANSSFWTVYSQPTGNTRYLYLNVAGPASVFSGYWNDTSPTASVFTLGAGNGEDTNAGGKNYVAYLFATCPGVSKVGTYAGNGGTQTINCGFTGGARFVLVKNRSFTGNWYVYDTARGMVSGTDPFLFLNSINGEATGPELFSVNGGFQLSTTDNEINGSSYSYIFLAIA
jgi:hypothetical protein